MDLLKGEASLSVRDGWIASMGQLALGWPTVSAVAAGLVWGATPTWWVAFTPLVIGAWWAARGRVQAGLVGGLYHLVAARHLVVGASNYFGIGVLTAAFGVALLALPIALLWGTVWSARGREESAWRGALRLLVLLGITYAPPVGAWAMASPLCGVGAWLPGTRWCGLAAGFAVLVAARRPVWLACAVLLAAVGAMRWEPTSPSASVTAVATTKDSASSPIDFEAQWRVAAASMEAASVASGDVVVLPESAAGLWLLPMRRMWAPLTRQFAAQGRTLVVGAMLERSVGTFDNVALVLGAGGTRVYRQRYPMPVAMWTPWSSRGFAAHWFGPGTVTVAGKRLGVLVCWEGALVAPVLASVAGGAEVLVAPANMVWLRGTGALQALRQSLEGWASLFALPVLIAANE